MTFPPDWYRNADFICTLIAGLAYTLLAQHVFAHGSLGETICTAVIGLFGASGYIASQASCGSNLLKASPEQAIKLDGVQRQLEALQSENQGLKSAIASLPRNGESK